MYIFIYLFIYIVYTQVFIFIFMQNLYTHTTFPLPGFLSCQSFVCVCV